MADYTHEDDLSAEEVPSDDDYSDEFDGAPSPRAASHTRTSSSSSPRAGTSAVASASSPDSTARDVPAAARATSADAPAAARSPSSPRAAARAGRARPAAPASSSSSSWAPPSGAPPSSSLPRRPVASAATPASVLALEQLALSAALGLSRPASLRVPLSALQPSAVPRAAKVLPPLPPLDDTDHGEAAEGGKNAARVPASYEHPTESSRGRRRGGGPTLQDEEAGVAGGTYDARRSALRRGGGRSGPAPEDAADEGAEPGRAWDERPDVRASPRQAGASSSSAIARGGVAWEVEEEEGGMAAATTVAPADPSGATQRQRALRARLATQLLRNKLVDVSRGDGDGDGDVPASPTEGGAPPFIPPPITSILRRRRGHSGGATRRPGGAATTSAAPYGTARVSHLPPYGFSAPAQHLGGGVGPSGGSPTATAAAAAHEYYGFAAAAGHASQLHTSGIPPPRLPTRVDNGRDALTFLGLPFPSPDGDGNGTRAGPPSFAPTAIPVTLPGPDGRLRTLYLCEAPPVGVTVRASSGAPLNGGGAGLGDDTLLGATLRGSVVGGGGGGGVGGSAATLLRGGLKAQAAGTTGGGLPTDLSAGVSDDFLLQLLLLSTTQGQTAAQKKAEGEARAAAAAAGLLALPSLVGPHGGAHVLTNEQALRLLRHGSGEGLASSSSSSFSPSPYDLTPAPLELAAGWAPAFDRIFSHVVLNLPRAVAEAGLATSSVFGGGEAAATKNATPLPVPLSLSVASPVLSALQDMLTDVDVVTLVREAVAAKVQARIAGMVIKGGGLAPQAAQGDGVASTS
jgi:hypothetical protein